MKTHLTNADLNYKKLWDESQVLSCYRLMSKIDYTKIVFDFFEKNHRIDILSAAIDNEQTSMILLECHSLRGASSMIGLVAFNDIINTIEQSCKKQSPLNKIEIISKLNDLLMEAKNQFLKLI
jgi:hypothetical protein